MGDLPVDADNLPVRSFASELHPDWCTAVDAFGCGVCGGDFAEIPFSFGAGSGLVQVAPVMESATGKAGVEVTHFLANSEISVSFRLDEARALITALQEALSVAERPTRRRPRPLSR